MDYILKISYINDDHFHKLNFRNQSHKVYYKFKETVESNKFIYLLEQSNKTLEDKSNVKNSTSNN